jgi:predicted  nucleic acid-binding Zn-ribbon protein
VCTHTLQQAQHAYTQARQLLEQNNLDTLYDAIEHHDHASAVHALDKAQHTHQTLTQLLSQVRLALVQVKKRYSDGNIDA